MTLSFQTKWPERMGELAGEPNYFTNKIAKAIWQNNGREFTKFITGRTKEEEQRFDEISPFESLSIFESEKLHPKLHTIRHDPHNRWKQGTKIHFVINNRTKNYFQFAPVIECMSVQEIIVHTNEVRILEINDSHITGWRKIEDMEQFAKNDGFPDAEYFMRYFHDFKHTPLSLIHWTNLKY